jgi:glycosyltransferase involved in cell wall biosynthesis
MMLNISQTMNTKQICLLLDSSKPGGIESHVVELALGLHRHGQDILVLFLADHGEHPMRELLTLLGIANKTLDGRFLTLVNTLRKLRPGILHTHGYKAGIFGRLAARLCRVKVITTYHAGEIATGKLALFDWADRLTAIFANQSLAVSRQIAKRLPVRAKVINNFINTSNLCDSHGQQIAFVGRISSEKGPDYFVHLAHLFNACEFHVYGDGPELKQLQNSPPDNLFFHGQQSDMSQIWSRIGLLVMPSRHEGLPMAALEAMARGIPVLAYQVGALEHLIQTGVNGWLVKPGNIAGLVHCLDLWLASSESQKQAMKCAAKNTVLQRFSSQVVIPELLTTYHQLAK